MKVIKKLVTLQGILKSLPYFKKFRILKKRTYIALFILCALSILLMFPKEKYYKNLLSLEKTMEENPDTALLFLQKMDVDALSEKEKALYYLLLSKGLDKTDRIPPSDSLIKIALSYYIEKQDSLRLFQSYYLRGRIFENLHFTNKASDNFQKAEEYSQSADDPYTQYLLNHYLGKIYHFKRMSEDEREAKMKALRYSRLLQDAYLISQSFQSMADWYRAEEDYKNSIICLKHAICLSQKNKEEMLSSIYGSLCENFLKIDEPDSALFYLHKAISLETQELRIPYYHSLKAKSFYQLQKNDSAEYYFNQSIDSLPLRLKASAYYDLFEIKEKQQNDQKALQYLKLHVRYRDSLDKDRNEEFMERIQTMQAYKKQKQLIKKIELELSKEKIWFYRIAIFSLFIVILMLITYFRFQKKKKSLKEIIHIQKQKATEALLNQKEIEYQLLKEKEEREKGEIKQLELTIDYYKRLNAITVPILLKSQNKQGAMDLSSEEWDIIIKNTDACFNQFTKRLKKNYPVLDENEIQFCCLVKMELPLSLLSEIYHIAKGSISRRKMRMKEKMNITQGSFDEFIKRF